jgi:hypothetical protein
MKMLGPIGKCPKGAKAKSDGGSDREGFAQTGSSDPQNRDESARRFQVQPKRSAKLKIVTDENENLSEADWEFEGKIRSCGSS